MTQLKTLNDIIPVVEEDAASNIIVNSLKQEAINWIKELERYKYPDGWTTEPPQEIDQFYEYVRGCPLLSQKFINWIKHFFNITEEELK